MVLIGFNFESMKHVISWLEWQDASILQMMCLRYSLKVMTVKLNHICWCISNMIIYSISANHIYLALLSFCWVTDWRLFSAPFWIRQAMPKNIRRLKRKWWDWDQKWWQLCIGCMLQGLIHKKGNITWWRELEKRLIDWRKRERKGERACRLKDESKRDEDVGN